VKGNHVESSTNGSYPCTVVCIMVTMVCTKDARNTAGIRPKDSKGFPFTKNSDSVNICFSVALD
jgi:hypothetical protein